MKPERSEAIIRAVIASLQIFADELEVAESIRPIPTPAVQHVIVSIRQCRMSLEQLLQRG